MSIWYSLDTWSYLSDLKTPLYKLNIFNQSLIDGMNGYSEIHQTSIWHKIKGPSLWVWVFLPFLTYLIHIIILWEIHSVSWWFDWPKRKKKDGSYLRFQNLTIGYKLPANVVSRVKMTNLRVYMSAQNLYTFTKYSGYDPEIGSLDNGILLMNVDQGHYPNPRTITFGVNVEF